MKVVGHMIIFPLFTCMLSGSLLEIAKGYSQHTLHTNAGADDGYVRKGSLQQRAETVSHTSWSPHIPSHLGSFWRVFHSISTSPM
jgi:hypothetical protein